MPTKVERGKGWLVGKFCTHTFVDELKNGTSELVLFKIPVKSVSPAKASLCACIATLAEESNNALVPSFTAATTAAVSLPEFDQIIWLLLVLLPSNWTPELLALPGRFKPDGIEGGLPPGGKPPFAVITGIKFVFKPPSEFNELTSPRTTLYAETSSH